MDRCALSSWAPRLSPNPSLVIRKGREGQGVSPARGLGRGPLTRAGRQAGRWGPHMAPLTNLLWNLFSFCLQLCHEMQVICGESLLFIFVISNVSNEVKNRTTLWLPRRSIPLKKTGKATPWGPWRSSSATTPPYLFRTSGTAERVCALCSFS